ncbi:hypothetical protein CcI49_02745 [Frankia sp. CcI49]|nr:hypothetical protein CcI49_02745 [Frankia sp. CcI49]
MSMVATTAPGQKPRVIPRNRLEFSEIKAFALSGAMTCVVQSRDSDYREIPRTPESAWSWLDEDPKARLLDLGDGVYKIERLPRPMWYLLRPKPAEDEAAS